jgi:hypothetical protein
MRTSGVGQAEFLAELGPRTWVGRAAQSASAGYRVRPIADEKLRKERVARECLGCLADDLQELTLFREGYCIHPAQAHA